MEAAPPVPPQQEPTRAELPADQRPATAEDLKGLRRWVIVAGVWAVAATALAVIALLKPAQTQDSETAAAATRSVNRVQDRLDERFDQLESRVGKLPQSSDLQSLGDRVQRTESRAGQAAADAKAARDSIGKLQDRVQKVERAQERQSRSAGSGSAGSGGRGGGDSTSPQSSGGQPQN